MRGRGPAGFARGLDLFLRSHVRLGDFDFCAGARPSNGLFILDTNGNGQLDAEDQVFSFWPGGLAGAIPVVGDWNGDGRTKVGLFYQGYEWILDYNGDGAYEAGIDKVYAYGGIAGDIPVVGDWTGTGTSKIGIFRPSSSGGPSWLLDANGDGVFAGADFLYYFGSVGDVPVVGDWSGSGTSKIGVFRYGNTWILDSNGDGIYEAGDSVSTYGGVSGDVPVVGKWNASEQSTDTQPVCVSSSGSCTATPQGQALPVMNTNVVSTPPPAPNPPYFLLTTQFIAQSTNANVASTVAGGQILVNVDTTTPPAALNGCYITWSVPLAVNSIAMPDAAAPAAESTGFGAGYTQFVYDNNCGVVGSGSSLTSSTTSNTSNGVTTYTATFTVTLALYFQPGFSGPHAVYASGTTTGGSPSPWINLGTLGIQPPPAMPAITTLAPQYVTLAPSASNTQIPLAYLGFNTSSSSDPITLTAAPVSDGNGNFLSATFQQSPATGSTTMTMSAPANMRPGSYTMLVMGRDTITGATSSRDVSATITSNPSMTISSDGVPVYITDLPSGDTCTGGDSTFGFFSQPDPFLAGYNDWSAYSIGGGANQYQINCSGLIYNVNILTPGPPLIYDAQSALTGNTPTCWPTACNYVAIDSSGSLDLPGENLTANGQTPQPLITSDDPNISFSLLFATGGYAVVNYSVGSNATTGQHTLTLTTVAGEATQTYTVADAYPVLTSIPPGVFDPYTPYTNITINGMHLGTNCPTINSSNMGIATFQVTGPCSDTSVVGNLQTYSPGTVTFTATGAGYNGNGFAPQQGAPTPPGLQAQVASQAVTPTCAVNINKADLASSIQTTLSTNAPGGLTGGFSLWQGQANDGVMNSAQPLLSWQPPGPRGPGAYNDGFNLHQASTPPGLYDTPIGQYTTIWAEWQACSVAVVNSYNFMFYNYGLTHQSQYGLIDQTTCSGGSSTAYIITNLNTCFAGPITTTTLPTLFMAQVVENGPGTSPAYGYLKALQASRCYRYYLSGNGVPPGANVSNTFVETPNVTGQCNVALSTGTVAAAKGTYACGDQIFIVGYGNPGTVKLVEDLCFACSMDPPHFDNWTAGSGANCSVRTVLDLQPGGNPPGYFVTEKRQQ